MVIPAQAADVVSVSEDRSSHFSMSTDGELDQRVAELRSQFFGFWEESLRITRWVRALNPDKYRELERQIAIDAKRREEENIAARCREAGQVGSFVGILAVPVALSMVLACDALHIDIAIGLVATLVLTIVAMWILLSR